MIANLPLKTFPASLVMPDGDGFFYSWYIFIKCSSLKIDPYLSLGVTYLWCYECTHKYIGYVFMQSKVGFSTAKPFHFEKCISCIYAYF